MARLIMFSFYRFNQTKFFMEIIKVVWGVFLYVCAMSMTRYWRVEGQ